VRQFFNYFSAADLYESFHRGKNFTHEAAVSPRVDEKKEETTDFAAYRFHLPGGGKIKKSLTFSGISFINEAVK
jgi:hypothetical protein